MFIITLSFMFPGELPANIHDDNASASLQRSCSKLAEHQIVTYFLHSGELDNFTHDLRQDHVPRQNRMLEILIMRMLVQHTGGAFIGLKKWTARAIKEVTN